MAPSDSDTQIGLRSEYDEAQTQWQKLWHNSMYSDVEIVTTKRTFHLHKNILDSVEFFAAIFRNGFKEGLASRVELKHDDPDTVAAMLEWIYTGGFTETKCEVEVVPEMFTDFSYTSLIDIYLVAEKYDLPRLKSETVNRFKEEMINNYLFDPTRVHAYGRSTHFLKAVRYLYELCPEHERELKEAILERAALLAATLTGKQEEPISKSKSNKNNKKSRFTQAQSQAKRTKVAETPAVNEGLLLEMPSFMIDLLRANREVCRSALSTEIEVQ
ncbi:MAG: hypothetical protein M1828_004023 [Chrysothrix sp. TS-e1954]|nr:MAG: hypothetical protein M1828_004023 [Chrysothrix sp. TS-e1954]